MSVVCNLYMLFVECNCYVVIVRYVFIHIINSFIACNLLNKHCSSFYGNLTVSFSLHSLDLRSFTQFALLDSTLQNGLLQTWEHSLQGMT